MYMFLLQCESAGPAGKDAVSVPTDELEARIASLNDRHPTETANAAVLDEKLRRRALAPVVEHWER